MNKYIFVSRVAIENPEYYGFESNRTHEEIVAEFTDLYESVSMKSHFTYLGIDFYKSVYYRYEIISVDNFYNRILNKTESIRAATQKSNKECELEKEFLGKPLTEVQDKLQNVRWRSTDPTVDGYFVTADHDSERYTIYTTDGIITNIYLG
jgi:hypothetical protein